MHTIHTMKSIVSRSTIGVEKLENMTLEKDKYILLCFVYCFSCIFLKLIINSLYQKYLAVKSQALDIFILSKLVKKCVIIPHYFLSSPQKKI